MFTDACPGSLWFGALLLLASATLDAAPAIQTWQAAGGARVLFVASPDLPMVDVALVLDAGSARDGDRSGLASLTAEMLTQGAGDWDADAIAARLEDVGAGLGAGADRDTTTISLRTLTRQSAMDTAVETLATLIARPRFADEDLERERRNRLVALRLDEESPRTVGQKAVFRHVFGSHPYGADPAGTPETVAAITRADLVDFHRRHYTGANAVVGIVGALDRPQAEALADRITAGLPRGERMPPLPDVVDLRSPVTDRIAFPSSQTTLIAGQPGMRRGDPDYFPLYVGNHILGGGGLVSRLVDEIREQRGLAYSTYSSFIPLAQPGPFLTGLQTKNDQAEQAQTILLATLRRFVEYGPTAAELTAAKKNLTGGFPLRIASNAEIVRYLAVIGFHDLPLDYLDRFVDRIEAVTVEQVRDAFSRRIDPDRLAIVLVGGGTAPSAGGEP